MYLKDALFRVAVPDILKDLSSKNQVGSQCLVNATVSALNICASKCLAKTSMSLRLLHLYHSHLFRNKQADFLTELTSKCLYLAFQYSKFIFATITAAVLFSVNHQLFYP